MTGILMLSNYGLPGKKVINYLLKEFRSARHAEALKLIDFAVHLLSMIR